MDTEDMDFTDFSVPTDGIRALRVACPEFIEGSVSKNLFEIATLRKPCGPGNGYLTSNGKFLTSTPSTITRMT